MNLRGKARSAFISNAPGYISQSADHISGYGKEGEAPGKIELACDIFQPFRLLDRALFPEAPMLDEGEANAIQPRGPRQSCKNPIPGGVAIIDYDGKRGRVSHVGLVGAILSNWAAVTVGGSLVGGC
jgi:hypothetical protein